MSAKYTPSGGPRLTEFLDCIPVETRWVAGHHITWTTGQQDRADGVGTETASHCSAFVAAVALALDLYVLRPPAHKQELLTNAQYAWLNGKQYPGAPDAKASNWQSLGLSGGAGVLAQAVSLAKEGQLVLAAFKSANPHKPGHICIVRPQDWSENSGSPPIVMSAGDHNYRSTDMKTAFKEHAGAWPSAIALFSCPTDLEKDSPAGTSD
jgi:hypothetical protein